jgi:DNA-binding NtrC family response regulator
LGTGELSPPAYAALRSRPWPGNVRELRNTLERARILANGGRIEPEHLSGPSSAPKATGHEWPWGTELLPIEAVEDRYVRWAAAHSGLTRRELAAHLGLSERQLYRRLGGG